MRAHFQNLLLALFLATTLGTIAALGLSRPEMPYRRVIMALLIIGGSLVYHWMGTTEYQNEFTGRTQTLALATPQEEIALGLQSAPEMKALKTGNSAAAAICAFRSAMF